MRSDTRRNMRRMLESARVVLATQPDATMADVASHAEVSTASAYRYFPSMEHLVEAVVLETFEDLGEFSRSTVSSGEDLMRQMMERWVELVIKHGTVLIQLRSRRGFLDRLDAGDPVIAAAAQTWARPVREMLGDACSGDALPRALMLMNQISDPREVRDLLNHGLSRPEELAKVIVETYRAAVPMWLETTKQLRTVQMPENPIPLPQDC